MPEEKFKVVCDTNIFISAILFDGNPEKILKLAQKGKILIFVSKEILNETIGVLAGDFGFTQEEIAQTVSYIYSICLLIKTAGVVKVIKEDETDNAILACASSAHADYLVTGDKRHILPLKTFGKIKIVSATQFLKEFGDVKKIIL